MSSKFMFMVFHMSIDGGWSQRDFQSTEILTNKGHLFKHIREPIEID